MAEGVVYVGVDESNHGRIPEIYTAVFSTFDSDITPCKGLQKERKSHSRLWSMLTKRDYSFLLVGKPDRETLGKDLLAAVVASLISGHVPQDHYARIFIDALEKSRIPRMRNLISQLSEIDRKQLSIEVGNDDQLPIINNADELAHYLFRHATLDVLATKYKNHRSDLLI